MISVHLLGVTHRGHPPQGEALRGAHQPPCPRSRSPFNIRSSASLAQISAGQARDFHQGTREGDLPGRHRDPWAGSSPSTPKKVTRPTNTTTPPPTPSTKPTSTAKVSGAGSKRPPRRPPKWAWKNKGAIAGVAASCIPAVCVAAWAYRGYRLYEGIAGGVKSDHPHRRSRFFRPRATLSCTTSPSTARSTVRPETVRDQRKVTCVASPAVLDAPNAASPKGILNKARSRWHSFW